jgi:hypothetical protein
MRFLLTLSLSLVAVLAFAQGAVTPKMGTPERKAIMDAMRVPVEKALKKKVVFKVDHIKMQNGWAFLYGVPQQPNGKKMDYRGTQWEQAIKDGMFDDNFCGLLRKESGKWKVKTWRIGMTDVAWIGWDKEYKAPKGIFPAIGG